MTRYHPLLWSPAAHGLEVVAKGCPQIIDLNLKFCSKVTNVGLQTVAQGCPQITSLNLSNCSQVTDIGLEAVADGCAQIANLNLEDCDKVSAAGKARLRAAPLVAKSETERKGQFE